MSKGLFDGGTIRIAGSPWSHGELRSIGVNRLKKRILCRTHNSRLSIADSEGIRAFRGIGDLDNRLAAARGGRESVVFECRIQGPLLERWFLKTAINLFVVRGYDHLWDDGAPHSQPPIALVRAAFGVQDLEHPCGLYNWAGTAIGQQVALSQQVQFCPLYRDSRRFVGAQFGFHGLQFLVWFAHEPIPWANLRTFYRHMGGVLRDGAGRGDLIIEWPPAARAAGGC